MTSLVKIHTKAEICVEVSAPLTTHSNSVIMSTLAVQQRWGTALICWGYENEAASTSY